MARELVFKVFEVCDRKWRGVGYIRKSGFKLRYEYRDHDAERLFDVADIDTKEPEACISGQILKGLKKPHDCPAFGRGGRVLMGEPTTSEKKIDEDPHDGPAATPDAGLLGASCPIPILDHKQIVMGHGSGGKLTAELIEKLFLPAFSNPYLDRRDDQAVFEVNGARLAFTTDSFVVTPIFFPGGDIGSLAVNGTVNDLAMSGARPLYLACAFILEEGLATEDLRRVVESMRAAAQQAGVLLVTGDTKVVNRGKGDQVFITTSGVGLVPDGVNISADRARPGDRIIVSGYIGDHGVAILSQRENLEFEGAIESDTAPLHSLVAAMIEAGGDLHCLRDPTRGGVATTLNEIASCSRVGIELVESEIPVRDTVQGACEILGLDPMYVANEGKLVAMVSEQTAEATLSRMREHPLGRDARIIGRVVAEHAPMVLMKTLVGGTRVVDVLFGEQLPRIC